MNCQAGLIGRGEFRSTSPRSGMTPHRGRQSNFRLRREANLMIVCLRPSSGRAANCSSSPWLEYADADYVVWALLKSKRRGPRHASRGPSASTGPPRVIDCEIMLSAGHYLHGCDRE